MKSSRKRPRPLWNYPTGPLDSLDFVFKLSYKSESCFHIIQNFDETAVFDSGKNWTQSLAVCISLYKDTYQTIFSFVFSLCAITF